MQMYSPIQQIEHRAKICVVNICCKQFSLMKCFQTESNFQICDLKFKMFVKCILHSVYLCIYFCIYISKIFWKFDVCFEMLWLCWNSHLARCDTILSYLSNSEGEFGHHPSAPHERTEHSLPKKRCVMLQTTIKFIVPYFICTLQTKT